MEENKNLIQEFEQMKEKINNYNKTIIEKESEIKSIIDNNLEQVKEKIITNCNTLLKELQLLNENRIPPSILKGKTIISGSFSVDDINLSFEYNIREYDEYLVIRRENYQIRYSYNTEKNASSLSFSNIQNAYRDNVVLKILIENHVVYDFLNNIDLIHSNLLNSIIDESKKLLNTLSKSIESVEQSIIEKKDRLNNLNLNKKRIEDDISSFFEYTKK